MEAIVQQAVENSLLQAAKEAEDAIDNQLKALDNLDDDDLERLRQSRIDQLKRQAQQLENWRARGHGTYREIDNEKDFFAEMKGEERMICHFFRNNWPCKVRPYLGEETLLADHPSSCLFKFKDVCVWEPQVMDKHMLELAQQHPETKFVKVNHRAGACSEEVLAHFCTLPVLPLRQETCCTPEAAAIVRLREHNTFIFVLNRSMLRNHHS